MQNNIDSNLITIISVLTASIVSILSIFVPVILELLRTRQIKITSAKEKLENATVDLLRELSYLGRPIKSDIEKSSSHTMQQVFSDLQVKHYVWERAIWSKLPEKYQKNIKALRVKFERLSSSQKLDEISQQLPEITNEILLLTHIASE